MLEYTIMYYNTIYFTTYYNLLQYTANPRIYAPQDLMAASTLMGNSPWT